MFHMWGQGYGMGLWVFILWALIIGVVAVVIYVLLNSRKHNQGSSANNLRQGNAVDMIKERYAKGEISREEYTQMMEDLKE